MHELMDFTSVFNNIVRTRFHCISMASAVAVISPFSDCHGDACLRQQDLQRVECSLNFFSSIYLNKHHKITMSKFPSKQDRNTINTLDVV